VFNSEQEVLLRRL